MTTATDRTDCLKCHATLDAYDRQQYRGGYCMTCYNGTPVDPADDDGMIPCDGCENEITDELYDANDGLCAKCLAKTFVCEECQERTARTDAHMTHGSLCEGCGDAKDEEIAEERLTAAKEAAQEAFDAILETGDLAVILKALAALKRLAPK
jgi:hypothetical protein